MPEKDEEEGGSSNKAGNPLDCDVDLIPMKREGEEGQDWIFLSFGQVSGMSLIKKCTL